MGLAIGESDVYFGTDVGKWGVRNAPEIFFGGCRRQKKFFLPHVPILKMLRFSWRIQLWVKNTKILTP